MELALVEDRARELIKDPPQVACRRGRRELALVGTPRVPCALRPASANANGGPAADFCKLLPRRVRSACGRLKATAAKTVGMVPARSFGEDRARELVSLSSGNAHDSV